MRRLFLFLPFLVTASLWGTPLEDRTRFYEALDHRDFGKMERILGDWEKGRAEEAEVLLARGHYFHAKAEKGRYKPNPVPAREEVILAHPPHWPGPSARAFERLDPKPAQRAVHYWRKAVQLYPWRMDIRFKLAGLYGDLGEFESQNEVLGHALLYAEKNRHRLKWENDQPLPHSYGKCSRETIGPWIEDYLARHRRDEDVKAFRLSRLLITFFPNNAYGYNFIAAYFSTQPDWPYALKYLMLAYKKDPKNSLILTNIGNVFLKLGKKKEAKVFYRKVVALNEDERLVMLAKEKLD